jgi:hypothetical protein
VRRVARVVSALAKRRFGPMNAYATMRRQRVETEESPDSIWLRARTRRPGFSAESAATLPSPSQRPQQSASRRGPAAERTLDEQTRAKRSAAPARQSVIRAAR